MNGIPAAANCAACSIMAWRPSGATIPRATPLPRPTPVQVRILHRARMKGGDLIVVEVGGDEGLRGKGLVDTLDVFDG